MSSKRFPLPNHLLVALLTVACCAMLPACAATASSNRPMEANFTPAQSNAQTIAQLEHARAMDEAELKDLTISVTRRGDLLAHEAAAIQATRDLQHGFAVGQDRLTYALEVPPSHLSSAQKTALLQQLQDAVRRDDAREQAVVAFSSSVYYEDPNAPSEFGQREQLARKEIKELKEGEHVSWDELQQALYVPPNPL